MKKLLSLILVFCALFALASCGKVPTGEITTSSEEFEVVNPITTTAPAVKGEEETGAQNEMDVITQSYYKYGENYAEIVNVDIESGNFSAYVKGSVDVKIKSIGSRKSDMYIGYKAYDATGELIRDLYIVAKLGAAWPGKTIKGIYFEVPRDTVKIEFVDYTE